MGKHNYLTAIDYELWNDLKKLKKLDNQSMNSLIQQGCRLLRDKRVLELSEQRKRRNTLADMVTA